MELVPRLGGLRASCAALAVLRASVSLLVSTVSCWTRRVILSRELAEDESVSSCRSRLSRVGRMALVGGRSWVGRGIVSTPRIDSRRVRRVSKSAALERVCVW